MNQIAAILLFFSLTVHSQTKTDKKTIPETIYISAVDNYLKSISNVDIKSLDTLFVEKIDSIDFNLPKVIQETIIEVLPINTIIIRLKDKADPSFLRLQLWTDNKSKTDIIAFQRTCNYNSLITEIIDKPENYRMSYIKKRTNSWKFIKTEKGTTGCRRFYKYENGQLYFYKSVCT